MPSPPSLTTHLLHLSPSSFTCATQTPFLRHAGRGTLPKDVLARWLAQDRLYAQAYVRFAAGWIGRVEMPVVVDGGRGLEERVISKPGATQPPSSPPATEAGGEADGGALRKEFIPNWTGDEFVVFVEKIEALVEEVWKGSREGEVDVGVLEGVWRDVLRVEEGFWPIVN
ncbi:hypothetical protein LHYA1_G008216 [Lachnellula hyalina]|uniref:Thiaminase-2/PQQC domain-containing protein n=1 Tax=Lachnellula hyalina TaxID=1316788 RepID=A0A8H8QWT0_9HELO|nr:uncharacterized protein LHYA1_G008216 [Lachnellula hyalina]TVY23160.1 hypothetical protein LHYA1_G008216 [Lachnellula hyalina]